MPLGAMSKPEIREIARSIGLKVAEKEDSQEICFVPGQDYKAFLRGHLGEKQFHRGGIYDKAGEFLAEHEGIEMFTIGQRKGLPGGSPAPVYVIDIDPETSRVIVGGAEDLVTEEFEVDRTIWNGDLPETVMVKIRYGHAGAEATVTALPGDRAAVKLHTPQRAVTPGQAAVFYEGDRVAGGGWICRRSALAPRWPPPEARHGGGSAARLQHVSRPGNGAPDRHAPGRGKAGRVRESRAADRIDLPLARGVETGAEVLALIKSTTWKYQLLEAKILELHPYEVPEIISVRIDGGHPPYLDWIEQSVTV